MPTSDNNLTTSNHYLVNTESDVSEITDQLSDSINNNVNVNVNVNDATVSSSTLRFVEATHVTSERELKQQKDQQEQCHAENEMPLSFASFYYSLKVIKGKG